MFTELGDNIYVDTDQDGAIILVTMDNQTGILTEFGLTIEEAEFLRDRLDTRIDEARGIVGDD